MLIAQADARQGPASQRWSQQVVAKTDGVPLFVEELLKMILESGLVREEADQLCADRPTAAAGHSRHIARLPDGPAGSAGPGQRSGTTRCRPGAGVSL